MCVQLAVQSISCQFLQMLPSCTSQVVIGHDVDIAAVDVHVLLCLC